MEMTAIQNIIFDFGGVILNIDHEKLNRAFQNLHIADFGQRYSQAVQSDLFSRLETGEISPDTFRNALRELCGLTLSDEVLDETWNAILLDIPVSRLELLSRLKSRYRIFLLSNTNRIHYDAYLQTLQQAGPYRDFEDIFEKAWFSFRMGMRKPNREIYLQALQEAGLDPAHTLFIDDSLQNIHAAETCGLQTFWLKPPLEISMLFDPESLTLTLPK